MASIRLASKLDIDKIEAIELLSFPNDPWSREALLSEIEFKDALVMVLEVESDIVGYGAIRQIFDEGHITTVAINPSMRRKGYGYQLVSGLLDESFNLGMVVYTLEVREHNIKAINLYSKLGFVVEGKRKRYYQNPSEDAIIMWKK